MPRNVLFIIADEFRADCLGAAGNPLIQTPNLDALAADGAMFTNCFVQASPCAPSRMCIMTGRYACSTGVGDNMTPLAEPEDNLALHLRQHGLEPATMGYNDMALDPRSLPGGHPHKTSLNYDYFMPGFDVVLKHEYDSPEWYASLEEKGYPPEQCCHEVMYFPNVPPEGLDGHLPVHYPAHYRAEDSEAQFMTSKAIEHIDARRGQGWFLNINYIKPHSPYICPAPYHAMYDPAAMPPPTRRPEELEDAHPYLPRFGVARSPELTEDLHWQELRACYYGMVSELDACLGRLFRHLKDTGQWENTLIVFTSDHGSYLGDHYLLGKPHFFESALHVPYIIRDPSAEANATRGTQLAPFCESIDTAPTVCEFLGVPPHERFQGASLLGHVRGAPDPPRKEHVFYQFHYYNALRDKDENPTDPNACTLWVVRGGRYKYVQFGEEAVPPLLFDLEADPGEFENLAVRPEHAATVAEYCQHLIRWRIRNEDHRMERWARQYR